MNSISKNLIAFSICTLLFFTACKKNNESPAPVSKPVSTDVTTNQPDIISSQIALNITQSLAGNYGGIDIKSGVNKPAFATKGSSVQISRFHALSNSLNSLCSFFVDSTLSYDSNEADTIKSHTVGGLKFFFNCTDGVSTGYTANDSLTTTGKASKYSFLYVVKQNYDTKSLNAGSSLLSVNGNLKSDVELTYNGSAVKTVSHDHYDLTGLTIDLTNNGDITGGSASFTSTGSNKYGSWNFTGTIVFLGNHKADISINGKTYHADLLTGKVS